MCFENDLCYVIFKYLLRRTAFYKVLREKDLILLKIQIMMDTKEVLVHWFVKFLIKIPEILKNLQVLIKLMVVLLKAKLCQTNS